MCAGCYGIAVMRRLYPGFYVVGSDAELDFAASEREGIDAVGVVVIVRARVGKKYLIEGFEMCGIERRFK